MTCSSCKSYNGEVCTLHTATLTDDKGRNVHNLEELQNLEEVNMKHFKEIEKRFKLVPPDPTTFTCSSFN